MQSGKQGTSLPTEVVWQPQSKPQKALVDCPLSEVFFGGARGGGKTDGVLGKWALKEQRYGSHFNARMFRKTTTASDDAIERAKEIYIPLGAKFNESKLFFRMPNGGRVAFGYLDSVADADAQQGKNLTDAWIEEAGQHSDSVAIDKLFGALRSAHGVPVQMILTANPGGAGQHWIAARYGLIPFPLGPKVVTRTLGNGAVHRMAVIPSRITDNRILLHSDPGYINRLHLVGSDALVKAWLEGDWSAIEGAFFDKWSARNVVNPFDVPRGWLRFRSFDWGYAKPFSTGWWAVASDDHPAIVHGTGQKVLIPRGALVRYREWYGCVAGKPNTGLRLETVPVAKGILSREAGDKITYGVADPSIFNEDGGPARSETFAGEKIYFRPADNSRVGRNGHMGGWDEMRQRIAGQDGVPMLYVFNTCKDFIRTVPVLQHDPLKAEDLDTDSEDHIADEARYACMSRPWVKPQPSEKKPGSGYRASGPKEKPTWR
jgi:hypothetical protein